MADHDTRVVLKIGLIGCGKMGALIEKLALEKGHLICAKIHSCQDFKDLSQADICIDFSHPKAAVENIKKAAELKKNLVMGTTGWYEHLPEAATIVKKSGIGFLYAPNFSIGVHKFLKIVTEASSLLGQDYDRAILEEHHKHKQDSPSGTALAIEKASGSKIPISSLRCGSIPGTHTLMFDSPIDAITLTHTAKSREGFAKGAIAAAEWLQGKTGFYTLEDML